MPDSVLLAPKDRIRTNSPTTLWCSYSKKRWWMRWSELKCGKWGSISSPSYQCPVLEGLEVVVFAWWVCTENFFYRERRGMITCISWVVRSKCFFFPNPPMAFLAEPFFRDYLPHPCESLWDCLGKQTEAPTGTPPRITCRIWKATWPCFSTDTNRHGTRAG